MSGETRKSRFLQQTVSDLGKEETHTNQRKIRGGNVLLSISLLVGADGGVGWGGRRQPRLIHLAACPLPVGALPCHSSVFLAPCRQAPPSRKRLLIRLFDRLLPREHSIYPEK